MNKPTSYLIMDETDRPYEKNESPYLRTAKDDELDAEILKELNLVSEKTE